mgnify:CR=1 FL=1
MWRRLPARLYGFYEPLEAGLGALPDGSAAGFDFSRRRKTPLLVRDLQSLGWRAGDIECLPLRRNLPRVDGFGRALGALYVVEGAMLGGQIPSRHFKTTLDLTPVNGAAFYAGYGTGRSRGTLPIQLAGNVRRGGLVELAFGTTLRELVFDFGGGTRSGRPVKAIQVGGPLGAYVPASQWDLPLDYEAYAAVGAVVGHGGIVVHDDTANLAQLARYAMEFCAIESCGKCTPCRIGSTRGVEVIDHLLTGRKSGQVELLRDLCDTMVHGSLCAMGGMTPYPVLSALDHYPQDFGLAAKEASHA